MKPPPRKRPAKKPTPKTETKQETPEDRVRLERKAQVYLPGEAVPWTVSSVVITGQETKMITQGIEQVTEMTLRLRRVVKVAKDE